MVTRQPQVGLYKRFLHSQAFVHESDILALHPPPHPYSPHYRSTAARILYDPPRCGRSAGCVLCAMGHVGCCVCGGGGTLRG